MTNNENFWNNLSFGRKMQKVVVNYFSKYLGYQLIFGDSEEEIDPDKVEEFTGMKFERSFYGKPNLLFYDKEQKRIITASMPDEFFLVKKDGSYRWNEIKGSRHTITEVRISERLIIDYVRVSNKSKIPVDIIAIFPGEKDSGKCNIYLCPLSELIKAKFRKEFYNSELCYYFPVSLFKKVNKYPIIIENFL